MPHIRKKTSIAHTMWKNSLSLSPLCFLALAINPMEYIKILGASLGCFLMTGLTLSYLLKNPSKIYHGHAFFLALLFSLFMPVDIPLYWVLIGALIAMGVGREIMGGIGGYLFHPVLLAVLFIQFFDSGFQYSGTIFYQASFFIGIVVMVLSLVLLVFTRSGKLKEATIFFLFILVGMLLQGEEALNRNIFFALFFSYFLSADSSIMPLLKSGKKIYIVWAGMMAVLAAQILPWFDALVLVTLLMSALTPWIESSSMMEMKNERKSLA